MTVDEAAQLNYRCPLTGTIGVRAFGHVEEMLETMIAGHRQFSRNGLPSVGAKAYVEPLPATARGLS